MPAPGFRTPESFPSSWDALPRPVVAKNATAALGFLRLSSCFVIKSKSHDGELRRNEQDGKG